MASHNTSITVSNNSLGVPSSSDGIMGLFLQGVSIGSTLQYNYPYLLTQLADAEALGITQAYDTANGIFVWGQINDFYAQALPGALLWVFIVPVSTAFATYFASPTFTSLIQQTAIVNAANRVKMIGNGYAPPTEIAVMNVFTGVATNDATFGGNYNSATLPGAFTVVIDQNGTIKTATLGAGGTGYSVNDVLTIVQGGASLGTCTVTGVSTGVITGISLTAHGSGYAVANGLATTGGGGTGATINVTAIADSFKWKYQAGSFTTKIQITGAAQTLSNGVTVTIATFTGHTVTDQWVFTVSAGTANSTGGNAFPTDVAAGVTALQAAQQALFNLGYQFSAVYDGYNMNWLTAPANLPSQADNSAFAVSLCITSTLGNGVSQVGAALGRFARISVGHGFGAIADGPIAATTSFLTNGVAVKAGATLAITQAYLVIAGSIVYNSVTYIVGQTFTAVAGFGTFTLPAGSSGYVVANSQPVAGITSGNVIVYPGLDNAAITALGNAQYLFTRTWQNYPGFYWNDAATCEASNLALSTQEFNRVANKLAADALFFFTFYMNSNLPVNVGTGNVDQTWLNVTNAQFNDQYIAPLVANGDISGATLVVTGLAFNVNKRLNFTLTVVGPALLGNVVGVIQFAASL